MDIGQTIKDIREGKKMTQTQVAEQIGLDTSSYARIEKKGNKLSVEQLEKIAGVLGVSLSQLLTGNTQTVQSSERVKELEKRVNELEDRVKDKQFKIDTIEKEAEIFKILVFESLSNSVSHSDKIEDYVQVIENNKWLIPLLTGISYNSLKINEYRWKKYWSKAIDIVVNRIWDLIEDGKELEEELLLTETPVKKKYKRNRDFFYDPKFNPDDYDHVAYLTYFGNTKEDDKSSNEESK